nr:HNH endonuclease signature motif containing protein [Microbacterium amylolyticum]
MVVGREDALRPAGPRAETVCRCIIPGCPVPASQCEVHHVTEHSRGGPTHTDNGVLLCWHHHHRLDTSGWEIQMRHGRPYVKAPEWVDRRRIYRPVRNHARDKPLRARST